MILSYHYGVLKIFLIGQTKSRNDADTSVIDLKCSIVKSSLEQSAKFEMNGGPLRGKSLYSSLNSFELILELACKVVSILEQLKRSRQQKEKDKEGFDI